MAIGAQDGTHVIEQAVRRSHCSRTGEEHNCIGVCTIKPDGIQLDCKLCGRDSGAFWTSEQRRNVAAIFNAAGINIEILSAEAQERATAMYAEITKKLRGY